ncbi:MAG: hypothetical protein M1839_003708 [Geoglossum umbratile]|nr:MAG: hypothetical protein M1839_003708 [Geoglossum umbratile]
MGKELPSLTVADVAEWQQWLVQNHAAYDGVWLVLAKKGTTKPTSLTYNQALVEALCYGWIDGQAKSGDEHTHVRRFTPRRARSGWSKRNVDIVEQLLKEGRMAPAGLAEVTRAKSDGRWDSAYSGPASAQVPADLAAALTVKPTAQAMFDRLTSQNRYAILYRLETAKKAETRTRRLEQFVCMLERGETIHPQRRVPLTKERPQSLRAKKSNRVKSE